jgi:hypothetical protein
MSTADTVIAFTLIPLAIYLILVSDHVYWRNQLLKWAYHEELSLIEFRGAKETDSIQAVGLQNHKKVFRVRVRDTSGKFKDGWVFYGKNLNPLSSKNHHIKVQWDL